MPAPLWRFARMNPSAPSESPIQGEFFTSTADLADRFVRESIQNSLDAAKDLSSQPVHIRFAFNRGVHVLPQERAQKYLEGLRPHLEAAFESSDFAQSQANGNTDSADYETQEQISKLISGPMDSLVVEDFGTTGLLGSIYANGSMEKDNNFWGFFRSVGISPKSENAAGSWGLGKWVFSDVSRINSVIGMTLNEENANPLLMGQVVLKTHTLLEREKDVKYPSYGSYAAHSNQEDSKWLPLPLGAQEETDSPDELAFIREAQEDFNLSRGNSHGLSVIIPFPNRELTVDAIAQAVIIQYFLPIVKGQLIVAISDADNAERIIDSETVDYEVLRVRHSGSEERSPEALQKVIDLARWSQTQEANEELVSIDLPKTSDNVSEAIELENLRSRFDEGKPLAFLLKTHVSKRSEGKTRKETYFKMFIEKDETLAQGHDYYIRGHLHIPKIDRIKGYKARSLAIVESTSELGHLLRDSEGPAHTDWNPISERLKNAWMGGSKTVSDVRMAAARIIKALSQPSAPSLENVLADIFPAGTQDPQPPKSPDSRPPSKHPIIASRVANGFRISNKEPNEKSKIANTKWHLAFAYDMERGSKAKILKRFDSNAEKGYPDFSLETGQIEIKDSQNCDIKITGDNKVEFTVNQIPFHFSVGGFDGRDIITEITKITPDVDEPEYDSLQEVDYAT